MKRIYITPSLQTTHIATESLATVSLTATQGAEGLDVGGTTQENGITVGNVKVNTVEWEGWKE